MLRWGILILSMILLASCVSGTDKTTTSRKNGILSADKATVLITIGEGWVVNSGQAFVVLTSANEPVRFGSKTSSTGGAGAADRLEGNTRAFEHNGRTILPGTYSVTDWGFNTRKGTANTRQSSPLVLEAGKVYYLGSYFADNLTHTIRISNSWQEERLWYLSKFPELKEIEIINKADSQAMNCWKMDVTDQILAGNNALKDSVAECE